MTDNNPLKKYFRQPALYVRLPTQGKWYNENIVTTNDDHEIAVYGLTALDEIMLNTPDAMLNGKSLESVIEHCAPDIKNVKSFLLPDIDALFLAIKIATTKGKYEFDRSCPKCGHENNFEVDCQTLMDSMSFVEETDTKVILNDNLIVHVKPYSFEMKQLFLQRELEEDRTLRAIDADNKDLDEFEKARIVSEGIGRLSSITFDLVARSVDKIYMVKENLTVTDPAHIAEWLRSVSKVESETVITAVNNLNAVGVNRTVPAICTACNHEWTENLNFDPVSFFARR